jgi:ketosteroid isomerase-like protein
MTEADVVRIHTETFLGSLRKQQYDVLAALYSDDYMLIRPDGTVLSKKAVLSDLQEGGLTFREIELDDVKVRIHGDSALLTGESRTVTARAGKEAKAHFRFVAVYAERDGKIELIHFQSVNLPQ